MHSFARVHTLFLMFIHNMHKLHAVCKQQHYMYCIKQKQLHVYDTHIPHSYVIISQNKLYTTLFHHNQW